ncbi:50S ribosomal protein L20 [bacterium]|nr:50S ribosomal protein L20 [bacterium]
MPRATNNPAAKQRRKRVLKRTKGFFGAKKGQIREGRHAAERAMAYSYRDRKTRKRDFRRLWIVRINAAARLNGLSYSAFMGGLKKANIEVDRKVLADLAVHDAQGFARLAEVARNAT